jgi:hypothetical protein
MSNKTLSKKQNNRKNEYSTTSVSDMVQEGCGLLDPILGERAGDYATKLALDYFEQKGLWVSLCVLKHALNNNVDLDFGRGDSNDRTLIHWLVYYSAKIPFAKSLLFDVLNIPGINNYVNNQDKKGNTPALIALYAADTTGVDMNDVVIMLINKGANPKIKNNKGNSVVLENALDADSDKNDYFVTNNIFVRKNSSKGNNELKLNSAADTDALRIVKNLVGNLGIGTEDDDDESLFTRNVSATERMSDNVNSGLVGGNINSDSSVELINSILNKKSPLDIVSKNLQNNNQLGGAKQRTMRKRVTYSEQEASEQLSDMNSLSRMNIIGKQLSRGTDISSSMSTISLSSSNFNNRGGASSSVEKEYDSSEEPSTSSSTEDDEESTETSTDSENETVTDSATDSDGETVSSDEGQLEKTEKVTRELERFTDPDALKMHENAVKRIKDILKVDDITADAYKSVLWRKISEEMKGQNNKERSMELEKQSSDKKVLDKIDSKKVNEVKKIIKEIREKKEKKQVEETTNKDKKKSLGRFIKRLSEDFESDDGSDENYSSYDSDDSNESF